MFILKMLLIYIFFRRAEKTPKDSIGQTTIRKFQLDFRLGVYEKDKAKF